MRDKQQKCRFVEKNNLSHSKLSELCKLSAYYIHSAEMRVK